MSTPVRSSMYSTLFSIKDISKFSSTKVYNLLLLNKKAAGKGLTSWLSFVVSNCEFVTFPLVSWVRCGT